MLADRTVQLRSRKLECSMEVLAFSVLNQEAPRCSMLILAYDVTIGSLIWLSREDVRQNPRIRVQV